MLIAKETGWAEDYIMDMAIGKAWAYKHAVLRAHDIPCNYKTSEEEKQELYDLFQSM